MSSLMVENSSVKPLEMVSPLTKAADMNAVPRMMAKAERMSRSLCANRPRSMALSIAVQLLHAVQHAVRGGGEDLVDDFAVGQENHPVGVGSRVRVVGHHDNGLAVLAHRIAKEVQH